MSKQNVNVNEDGKKVITAAEFNKRVEMETEWIRRHEYESDKTKSWNLAKYRISQDYQVG